jgi:L-ascorbate metabolism protein UlaG (beta-lactamase superfamily)
MPLPTGTTITWYGHSCIRIDTAGGVAVVIDPWFANPRSPIAVDAVDRCDVLLVTHGHFDHMGEAVALAARLKPTIPCVHEMSLWFGGQLPDAGDRIIGMNKGGTVVVDGLTISMVTADHSGGDWDAGRDTTVFLGEPVGFIIELEDGYRIYHVGDTALTGDLRLVKDLHHPDLAMVPIGGHYTMDPDAAAIAIEYIAVDEVVPIHYGTFPILAGTPAALRAALADRGLGHVRVHEPEPGGTLTG